MNGNHISRENKVFTGRLVFFLFLPKLKRGTREIAGEKLRVVQVEFSTLSLAVSQLQKKGYVVHEC